MYIYVYIIYHIIVKKLDYLLRKYDPFVKKYQRFDENYLLKTPCGVTPPPPHFWSSAFHDLFLRPQSTVSSLSKQKEKNRLGEKSGVGDPHPIISD